jgi:hypothetical protein
MREAIAWLANKIGWVTWYHITYQFPVSSGGTAICDACISVRPWIRRGESLQDVRKYISAQAIAYGGCSDPNIISLTKIGA